MGCDCARRSRAAGAPRLGEGWHTQVHVCLSHDKLQHPSTLDGMRWDEMGLDGMGWDGDLTGWDWTGRDEMGWDVLCAPELCRRSATPGRGLAHPGTCVPQP